ncbi:MAG: CRISPR-associated endonuclease Cas1 [Motiliproteus sp.]
MSTIILDRRKLSLSYEADCLFVRSDDIETKTIPLCQIKRIICLHGVNISTQLLGQLRYRGIDFSVVNSRYPQRSLTLPSDPYRGAQRRIQQCLTLSNEYYRLLLARRVVGSKLHQQHLVGGRYKHAVPTKLVGFTVYQQRCRHVESLETLRGLEGAAAAQAMALYVQQFPQKFNFKRRVRRPPTDPVNALLSLCFTLLYRDGANVLQTLGLDPWLGFYHEPLQGRYSLACDLMEPLRPHVEAFVHQLLVTEKTINLRHFCDGAHGCFLGKEGRKLFFPLYEEAAIPWRKQLQRYGRWLIAKMDQLSSGEPLEQ